MLSYAIFVHHIHPSQAKALIVTFSALPFDHVDQDKDWDSATDCLPPPGASSRRVLSAAQQSISLSRIVQLQTIHTLSRPRPRHMMSTGSTDFSGDIFAIPLQRLPRLSALLYARRVVATVGRDPSLQSAWRTCKTVFSSECTGSAAGRGQWSASRSWGYLLES